MKALILNSGMGSRMGSETKNHPKCMTLLDNENTILSKQLSQLESIGINEVVITTGYLNETLETYCLGLNKSMKIRFVYNPNYIETNYIYSIYLAKELLHDDILLLHGDLVFHDSLIEEIIRAKGSYIVVDSSAKLPEKDFKAVIINGIVRKIGVTFFDNAVAAQPLYKLDKKDWEVWLKEIILFCEQSDVNCYAENAFNKISDKCTLYPFEVGERLCREIDTMDDWLEVREKI